MALKINKQLTSRDGGKIDAGSIVTFQITIPPAADEIGFDISVFRDERSVRDRSVGPVFPVEIGSFGVKKNVDPLWIMTSTYADHIQVLKEHLESLDTIGKCIDLVDLGAIVLEKQIDLVEEGKKRLKDQANSDLDEFRENMMVDNKKDNKKNHKPSVVPSKKTSLSLSKESSSRKTGSVSSKSKKSKRK